MRSKSNEEKAREIANNCSTEIIGAEVNDETYITTEPDCYTAAMAMAKWKDSENRWHKISEGDFPKTTGNYLTVCRNKNKEDGIFLYEVVYYTGDGWEERTSWEDIIAWREVPEYK